MKNILFIIFTFFITVKVNAQEVEKSNLFNKIDTQKVHPESIILNQLNTVNGSQVLQTGNYNLVDIEGEQMQVNQTGDYQLLYYTETSKLESSNMNINMEGANNYIEIYGNNSIIENMQINVQGNDRTVIIRNY